MNIKIPLNRLILKNTRSCGKTINIENINPSIEEIMKT